MRMEPIRPTCGSPCAGSRRKLELDADSPRFLLTERGLGYRLASVEGGAPALAD